MDQSIWSKIAHAPRIAVEFTVGEFADNLPRALASLGVVIAGLAIAYLFIKLAEIITRARSSKRYKHNHATDRYIKTTQKSSQSIVRLVCMCLAFSSCIFGFWIGANVLGVNFWTITLSYGILALVLNTAFGTSLRNAGAFFLIAWSDKIEEDWFVNIGNQVQGRVVAIHILWIELEVGSLKSKDGLTVIHVPTYMIMGTIMKRILKYETKRSILPIHNNNNRNLKFTNPV